MEMGEHVILIDRWATGSLADVEVHGPYGDHEDVEAIARLYREAAPDGAVVEIATVRR
jgi:hypothetical protein